MNQFFAKLAIAGFGLLLGAGTAQAQDLVGSWTWTTACKGNFEGASHKYKLTTNLDIVDGPEDTFTATDGSGTTFTGRAIVNAAKPTRFSAILITDSISQDLDTEAHMLFVQGSIKDGAVSKLKGTSNYAEAYTGTGYAFQCKDKLARTGN